jgi:hypothetical protein
MRKTKVDWERFEDEEKPQKQTQLTRPDTAQKKVQQKAEIIPYKFTDRERAQVFNRWERKGNSIHNPEDSRRFEEYVQQQAILAACARHDLQATLINSPSLQKPVPKRPDPIPWIRAPAYSAEKAISSDDLFPEQQSVPILQQIGQKLQAFRDQLSEDSDAPDSEVAKSGLL